MSKPPVVPPSREVRFEDGVTQGFAETVALRIYQGSTDELLDGVTAIELTIEARRADAARTLAALLRVKLAEEGYIVASDIDDTLYNFLEAEISATI